MAHSTLPARADQSRTEPHGFVRWCGLRPTPNLLETGSALLSITPIDARGRLGEAVTYWVRRVEGGYELAREDGAVYHVDTTFGPAVEHWFCSCPAAEYRPHKVCKHRAGLFTALRAVGLLAVPAERDPFPAR